MRGGGRNNREESDRESSDNSRSPQRHGSDQPTVPPPPKPGPPIEVEEFPPEQNRRINCLALVAAFVVIVVGLSVALWIFSAFVSDQSRPFSEGEQVTRAFLGAAVAGDIPAMRSYLSDPGLRAMSEQELEAISKYMQENVGNVVSLERSEQEVLTTDGRELVHLAFVIHGASSSASIDVSLEAVAGDLKITNLALR